MASHKINVTNQGSRYKSWPQVCFRRHLGWILMGERCRKEKRKTIQLLVPCCSQLTTALHMLVVPGDDISSVEWFCCYGKSAKKGWNSCRAPILWVFNVQFLLRTLRIIPLIVNCLNVETYGPVCCSLGNNWLFPSCQIQINSGCRKGESAQLRRTLQERGFYWKANLTSRKMLIKLSAIDR